MLNFIDITAYKRLKLEEEKGKMLTALNTSVHHEMLGPLKAIVEFSERLVRSISNPEMREICQTIFVASKLVMLHANDLLD